MRHIEISPTAQVIGLLALFGLIAAGVAAQLPELRRYLKIDSM